LIGGRFVGTSLRRREDVTLLRGETRFIADLDDPILDNAAHVVFVRSPHAHARIVSIDVHHAAAAHGVLDVVHNAIIDAVAYLGIEHIDLPCTPERIWNAIELVSS